MTFTRRAYSIDADQEISWPKEVSVTATGPVDSWKLRDPKNGNRDALLNVVGLTASYTPLLHSGLWVLTAYDEAGVRVLTHTLLVGDAEGWMTFPDWDDAAWTVEVQAGGVVTGRSGKNITIGDVSVTAPESMDIIYTSLEIPDGLSLETEVYLSTISGDDNTGIFMLGGTVDAANPAFLAAGAGMEQSTAGTQRPIQFKDNITGYVCAAHADIRRCRTAWALDSNRRSPGVVNQALDNAAEFHNFTNHNYGGIGFAGARDIGLWVGRLTADGSPYTVEVTGRIKVT